MMDLYTETWVILNDDGTPLSMSALEIAQRIYHRTNLTGTEIQRVFQNCRKLVADGKANEMRIDGTNGKIHFYSEQGLKDCIEANRELWMDLLKGE